MVAAGGGRIARVGAADGRIWTPIWLPRTSVTHMQAAKAYGTDI